MKRAVTISFLVAAFALAAVAQHGTAQAGDANPSYGNDTWTGTVASVDPATLTIVVAGPSGEKFTGNLHKPLEVVDASGQPVHGGRLGVGSKVELYYVPKGQSFAPANSAAPVAAQGQEANDKQKSSAAQGSSAAQQPPAAQKQTAQDNYVYKIKLLDSASAPAQAAPQTQPPPK